MEYVVQKGDTLYGIGKQFGVSVEELMRLNQLINTNVRVGTVLKIPNSSINYVVKKGDTLYSISQKYNTTVDKILSLNNLSNTMLNIGQVLKVPGVSDSIESDIYVVKKGDTLYSIAKKVGVSVPELIRINQLKSTVLTIGQVLYYSEVFDTIEIGSSCYGDVFQEVEYITYTVEKGDNLYSIAKKYGVSVDSIKKLNQLKSNLLNIGQVLKIKEVL